MPHDVTMPQLGMAQDAGRIIAWLKKPGDRVSQGDALFEVETDKATMEVEAQAEGFLTHISAAEGEDVPVGRVIARISDTADAAPEPDLEPVVILPDRAPERPGGTVGGAAEAPAPKQATVDNRPIASTAPSSANGRILASPKARRLALLRGVDLAQLAAAGAPQPIHVRDVEAWSATVPTGTASAGATSAAVRRITSETAQDGFTPFAAWAADTAGITDPAALLAGFAAASLRRATGEAGAICVAVSTPGTDRCYPDADRPSLGRAESASDAPPPRLVLRDLRGARITAVEIGDESAPVLTVLTRGSGLSVTLEWGAEHLAPQAAIELVEGIAGRLEEPLRHLL